MIFMITIVITHYCLLLVVYNFFPVISSDYNDLIKTSNKHIDHYFNFYSFLKIFPHV
jgi:hypothetical protein